MSEFALNHEAAIRLWAFATVLVGLALWEVLTPCRVLSISKSRRWMSNLGFVVINTLILRLMFPAAAVGAALFAQAWGWGLFSYFDVPYWVVIILSVLVLDFAIYLQHVLFHAVPVLWRVHRMHHADLDFDVTTGVRFHPIEIVLSMLMKLGMIAALGAPAVAVLIFEVLLSATSLFNHSNVRMPQWLERVLRWIVVTPYMHRVHHSVEASETNSNFSFNLPWWDRLFGTYRDQPREGHQRMTIGIRDFRDSKSCTNLLRLLSLPFVGRTGDYAINRRWEKHRENSDPINGQVR